MSELFSSTHLIFSSLQGWMKVKLKLFFLQLSQDFKPRAGHHTALRDSKKFQICVCEKERERLLLHACVHVVLHIVLLMRADMGTASSLNVPSLELERGTTQKQQKSKRKQNPEINMLTNKNTQPQSPYLLPLSAL